MLFSYARSGTAMWREDPFRDIEAFFAAVYRHLHTDGERDIIAALEIQPGDGTRYRVCIAMEAFHERVTVAMSVPSFCVAELDPAGPRPDFYDEPMNRLNPFTNAIFSDVLAGCVWGHDERFYDYAAKWPGPKGFEIRSGIVEDTTRETDGAPHEGRG